MMNFPGVIFSDKEVIRKIECSKKMESLLTVMHRTYRRRSKKIY